MDYQNGILVTTAASDSNHAGRLAWVHFSGVEWHDVHALRNTRPMLVSKESVGSE
jgi:hypothetical protein